MVEWEKREVEGFGMLTCTQYEVLQRFDAARDAYGPLWVDRESVGVRWNTIRALEDRDFIAGGLDVDGRQTYCITRRGENALEAFAAPMPEPARTDGICPSCGERPKAAQSSYCLACRRERAKRRYHRNPKGYTKPGLCSRCKVEPRYQSAAGYYRTYCKQCWLDWLRERRQRATE